MRYLRCRKLPFLSLSLFCLRPGAGTVPLSTFLAGLRSGANRMQEERNTTLATFSHI